MELGPRDLAMTRSEAATLLRLAGLELDRDGVETLVRRTEGCAAGLSLAALALGERTGPPAPNRFSGEDRLVADYLRDEILGDLSAEQLEFVLRTSVLDTLTGPLCDAVLGRSGSAATLSALGRVETCCSWRSIAPMSATAITACSARCCGLSYTGASPSS